MERKARKTEQALYTMREVAEAVGVSYRTVHRYAKLKRIKTVRLGGQVRVPRQELERILAKGF